MKGTIFVQFMEHIEKTFGMEMVDEVLISVGDSLSTGGSYTSVGNYPHAEILTLATAICKTSGTALESLIREFASYLMQEFYRLHPKYFDNSKDVFIFLLSLESEIHTDVRKLYKDARPPLIEARACDDGSLILEYQSTRPLAQMALELTRAAGEFFKQPLQIDELERGEDQCSLTIKVRKSHG